MNKKTEIETIKKEISKKEELHYSYGRALYHINEANSYINYDIEEYTEDKLYELASKLCTKKMSLSGSIKTLERKLSIIKDSNKEENNNGE